MANCELTKIQHFSGCNCRKTAIEQAFIEYLRKKIDLLTNFEVKMSP